MPKALNWDRFINKVLPKITMLVIKLQDWDRFINKREPAVKVLILKLRELISPIMVCILDIVSNVKELLSEVGTARAAAIGTWYYIIRHMSMCSHSDFP